MSEINEKKNMECFGSWWTLHADVTSQMGQSFALAFFKVANVVWSTAASVCTTVLTLTCLQLHQFENNNTVNENADGAGGKIHGVCWDMHHFHIAHVAIE